MDKYKEMILLIENGKFTLSQLVSLLVLIVSKMDINTISGMARSEKKTPRGIRISNQYSKIDIGAQKMAIKGVKDDGLPF